jgi:enamine deaminase RidA (YjgF/YER057c/UK114 family)
VDELAAQVATEKQRLDSLVPTFETTFKEAQDERQAAFDEVQEELKTNAASVVTELKTSFEETVTSLTENSEVVLAEVKARRDEVVKLYGVITNTATTGAFRDEAEDQKRDADRWRRIAVVFGALAAVAAVGAVVLAALSPETATSTSAIVGKITVTLAAAGVAAYAGRQSGRHRRREEEAKRLELELVAFPPFIDSLEPEQQREVRKDFAERAFRGRPADLAGEGRRRFRKEDTVGIAVPELLQLVHDLAAMRDEKRQS